MGPLQSAQSSDVDFLEVAPENWIGVGGALGRRFNELASRWPLYCHGLSLSLGGHQPFDEAHLGRLRRFLDRFEVVRYSEHLSYTTDDGQLYDLMPLPFVKSAVRHVADRISQVQDALKRRISIENVSYYTPPSTTADFDELEFITRVVEAADCDLLLDVNNIHVNSINQGYNAADFLRSLPADRVAYIHVAGHFDEAADLIVDTHGAAVIDPVFELLDVAYQHVGVKPTLLERDFNFPPLSELLGELDRIRSIQATRSVDASGRLVVEDRGVAAA